MSKGLKKVEFSWQFLHSRGLTAKTLYQICKQLPGDFKIIGFHEEPGKACAYMVVESKEYDSVTPGSEMPIQTIILEE